MRKEGSRKQPAFTLLEMIAVLVLLGLISTIAMISVIGHLEQTELGRVSQLLANADRKERDATRHSPFPGAMTVDRSKKRVQFLSSGRTIDFGKTVNIAELIVNGYSSADGTISFTQSGQSPTYAIRLESRRGAICWVLVIGMTGQVLFTDSTEDVRSLLAMGR